MKEASAKDLRDGRASVIDRVIAGECVKATRSGRCFAELRPLPRQPTSAAVFLERVRSFPRLDPDALRKDIDAVTDPRL